MEELRCNIDRRCLEACSGLTWEHWALAGLALLVGLLLLALARRGLHARRLERMLLRQPADVLSLAQIALEPMKYHHGQAVEAMRQSHEASLRAMRGAITDAILRAREGLDDEEEDEEEA